MRHPKNEFWIWLSGFIDGDGSIGIYKNRHKPGNPTNSKWNRGFQYRPAISIYSARKNLLEWLDFELNNRGIKAKYYIRVRQDTRENRGSKHVDGSIQIRSHQSIFKLLNFCIPYFKIKDQQAKVLERFIKLRLKHMNKGVPLKFGPLEDEIYDELKQLNKKPYQLEKENE